MKPISFKNFFRREDGTLSVEAVFAIPMLVWVTLAMIVFFDAFRQVNAGQKATHTIADMLSRERSAITPDYLDAALETFEFLTDGEGNNALRVTVLTMTEDPITLVRTRQMVWSEGVGGATGYANLDTLEPRLPDMAPGDQMIVVEGEHDWSPGFSVGLTSYRFGEVSISRPRFAPQLCWLNCGSGGTGGTT